MDVKMEDSMVDWEMGQQQQLKQLVVSAESTDPWEGLVVQTEDLVGAKTLMGRDVALGILRRGSMMPQKQCKDCEVWVDGDEIHAGRCESCLAGGLD